VEDRAIQKNPVRIAWFNPGVLSFDFYRKEPRASVRLFVFLLQGKLFD